MTMLVSWIGIDTHGVSSSYIISDSRFTWQKNHKFDFGKKVFASKKYPELFGYAGDVLFPSIVLSQIIEMIDSGVLLTEKMTCDEKHKIIREKICFSLSKYPDELGNKPVQIIHISRETLFNGYPSFHHYYMNYDSKNSWQFSEEPLPDKSGLIKVIGSGTEEFLAKYQKYQSKGSANTTRNVYHCFVDTLEQINDPFCGGAPQLVGLIRKPESNGINYGIIYKDKRYILGMEVPNDSNFQGVEWRNMNFEISDGNTKKIIPGAARQPRPSELFNLATP